MLIVLEAAPCFSIFAMPIYGDIATGDVAIVYSVPCLSATAPSIHAAR